MDRFNIKNFMMTILIMLFYLNEIQGSENRLMSSVSSPCCNCKEKLSDYTVTNKKIGDDSYGAPICHECALMGYYNSAARGKEEKLKIFPGKEIFNEKDTKQNAALSDYNKEYKSKGIIAGIFSKSLIPGDFQPNFYEINDSDNFNRTIMPFMNNKTIIKQLLDVKVLPEIQKNWIQHFVANEMHEDKISDEIWDFMASYLDTPVCIMGHHLMEYEKGGDDSLTENKNGAHPMGHTCDECKINVTDGDFYCNKDNKCDYDICKHCLKLIEERTKMLKEVIPIYVQERRINKKLEPRKKKRDELQQEIDAFEKELEELKEKKDLQKVEENNFNNQ